MMLCLLVVGGMSAQEQRPAALGGAPEYVGYTQVYDFIDELADMGIISVNSVVKPYDRNQIAAWLREAAEVDSLLSVRQRKELWFYLNDFALECEGMYDGVVQWSNAGDVVNKELWGDAFSLKSTVNSQQSTVNITPFGRYFCSAQHSTSKLDSAFAYRKKSMVNRRPSGFDLSPTEDTDNLDFSSHPDLLIRSLASQEIARRIDTDFTPAECLFHTEDLSHTEDTECTEFFRQRLKDRWLMLRVPSGFEFSPTDCTD